MEHRIASFGGFFVFFFFMHSASMAKISCKELQSIQKDIFCLEGYHSFRTEEEYKRLREEYPMVSKKETVHARCIRSKFSRSQTMIEHKNYTRYNIKLFTHIYQYYRFLALASYLLPATTKVFHQIWWLVASISCVLQQAANATVVLSGSSPSRIFVLL